MNKTKKFTMGLVAAAMIVMTAFSASARSRVLSPADVCEITNNDPDLYFNSIGEIAASGYGCVVCVIPNDTYLPITDINLIAAHHYNSSLDNSTLGTNVCTRSYSSVVTDCEGYTSTSTIGDVMLSWTGLTLTPYLATTYLRTCLYRGDKVRMIYVSE